MTVAVASLLAFASALALVLGLAEPIRRSLARATELGVNEDNELLGLPVLGPVVRFLTYLNEEYLAPELLEAWDERLLYGGRPGGMVRGAEFLAAAEALGLGVALTFAFLFGLAGALSIFALLLALVVGGFAGLAVLGWLVNLVEERQVGLGRQFPYFLDLAIMAMEAGSTFREVIEIYIRDNPDDILTEELQVLVGELDFGKTLREALEAFAARVASEDIGNTVRAVVQGLKMGTPIGQVLRDQGEVMRFRRSQRAERMAEELKVRIQGPAILMMIAIFLLILGPAFIRVSEAGIFG
jgi:tight adherence protein C